MVRKELSISVAAQPNPGRNGIVPQAVEGAGFNVLSYGQR